MPTPKNQITLRALPGDIEAFHEIHARVNERSVIPAKAGDVHRLIYRRGLIAWRAELGLDDTATADADGGEHGPA